MKLSDHIYYNRHDHMVLGCKECATTANIREVSIGGKDGIKFVMCDTHLEQLGIKIAGIYGRQLKLVK